jgi:aryl-alcohol dehydrogenase-like predicted oxidoreductase
MLAGAPRRDGYRPGVNRRTLGSTGLEVGEIGLGAWQLDNPFWGGPAGQDSERIVRAALEAGCNLFDTAPGYGGGRSEKVLGRALEHSRDEVVLVTKFGHSPEGASDFRVERLEPALGESLGRLRTDRVDVLLLHNPPADWHDGSHPVYRELERLRDVGSIGAYGVSLDWAADLDLVLDTTGSTVVEVLLNTFHQEPLPAVERAHASGVGVIVKVPLDSGWLSGKYRAGSSFADVRDRWAPEVVARRAELLGRFEGLLPHGTTTTAGALQFLLAQEAVSCVIPGAKSAQQLQENVAAADEELPAETVEAIRGLWREELSASPLPW